MYFTYLLLVLHVHSHVTANLLLCLNCNLTFSIFHIPSVVHIGKMLYLLNQCSEEKNCTVSSLKMSTPDKRKVCADSLVLSYLEPHQSACDNDFYACVWQHHFSLCKTNTHVWCMDHATHVWKEDKNPKLLQQRPQFRCRLCLGLVNLSCYSLF